MSGSPECSSGMEANGGDAIPTPGPCTARFLLGLQLSGEAVTGDVLDPLAADGRALRVYGEGAGALVGAGLACDGCMMANVLKVDREGGIETIDRVSGRPTMADACTTSEDGVTSAGQAVMNRLQGPV